MPRYPLAIFAALLALLTGPAARTQAPYPAVIGKVIEQQRQECRSQGGKFTVGKAEETGGPAVRNIGDLNGDGQPDYILYHTALVCSTSGASGSCGTAGCSMDIFTSSPRGYLVAMNAIFRDLRVVKVGGKPALSISAHGSACGKAGAAMCGKTFVWKKNGLGELGKPGEWPAEPYVFYNEAPAAPVANRPAPARPVTTRPAAIRPTPPRPLPNWTVQKIGGQNSYAAILEPAGQFRSVSVACMEGKQHIYLDAGNYTNRTGRALLRLSNPGRSVTIPMALHPRTKMWFGSDSGSDLYAVMTGMFPSADITFDGRTMGVLSFETAVRPVESALGPCSGAKTLAQSTQGLGVLGPHGFKTGYYVSGGQRCEDAASVFFYDGKRIGEIYGLKEQSLSTTARARKGGDGRWFFPEAGVEVRPLGGDRIQVVIQDEVTQNWCAASRVPAELRR